MDDEEYSHFQRWCSLINARGISGGGARETDEEKRIVEVSIIREFINTLQLLNSTHVSQVQPEPPTLPDFSCMINKEKIHIELTEFIDPNLIMQAKHIRATADHPLHSEGLRFDTSYDWFSELLGKVIEKKEIKYKARSTKIDVLVIWNEAGQLSIKNTQEWLERFTVPNLEAIKSIYFQTWYHPRYKGRPTWTLIKHSKIGKLVPTKKDL